MSISASHGVCQSCGEREDLVGSLCIDCHLRVFPEPEIDVTRVGPWRRASEVTPREIEYLWFPRIALGKVTLVAGDPGLGKSLFTMALAAAVTQGHSLPDSAGKMPVGSVLVASYEDDPEDGIVPRLMRQGADLDRIILLDQYFDEKGFPRLFGPDDIPSAERQLDDVPDAKLLIIDPVMAFLGSGVDVFRDNQVRSRLQPLVKLAAMRGMAIVAVMHLNKGELTKALYKVSGSIGFTALSRSTMIVGQDAETGKRGIAHIKSNSTALASPLEFFIEGGTFRFGMANEDLTAERMLKPADGRKTCTSLNLAKDVLVDLLSSGPVASTEVMDSMEAHGISRATAHRAKEALGIAVDKDRKKDGKWYWRMP